MASYSTKRAGSVISTPAPATPNHRGYNVERYRNPPPLVNASPHETRPLHSPLHRSVAPQRRRRPHYHRPQVARLPPERSGRQYVSAAASLWRRSATKRAITSTSTTTTGPVNARAISRTAIANTPTAWPPSSPPDASEPPGHGPGSVSPRSPWRMRPCQPCTAPLRSFPAMPRRRRSLPPRKPSATPARRRRLSYRLRRLRVRERPPATGSGRSRRPTPPT